MNHIRTPTVPHQARAAAAILAVIISACGDSSDSEATGQGSPSTYMNSDSPVYEDIAHMAEEVDAVIYGTVTEVRTGLEPDDAVNVYNVYSVDIVEVVNGQELTDQMVGVLVPVGYRPQAPDWDDDTVLDVDTGFPEPEIGDSGIWFIEPADIDPDDQITGLEIYRMPSQGVVLFRGGSTEMTGDDFSGVWDDIAASDSQEEILSYVREAVDAT